MGEMTPAATSDQQADLSVWSLDEFSAAVDGLDPIVLRVAATLGLADAINGGHDSIERLSVVLACHSEALSRLLEYLVVRGVFAKCHDGRIKLGDYGAHLLDDHPSGLRRWLTRTGPGAKLDAALYELEASIRDGGASYQHVHDKDFFADAASPTPDGTTFNSLRADHGATLVRGITQHPLWSRVSRVVDVGGGEGELLCSLLEAQPHLHGTLVDLEPAVTAASVRLRRSGTLRRCTLAAGSFFDPLPSAADVYLLANVLHNWSDDDACRILTQCRETEGNVLILETLTDRIGPRVATSMDLRMLSFCAGKERTTLEFKALLHGSGYALSEISTVSSELFAISASPVQ